MTTVTAVYENGVLRPTRPLTLAEGQTVEVTVDEPPAPTSWPSMLPPPTPEEQAYIDRLRAAKTLEEAIAVMATAPPGPGDDFDIVKAINESRRLTGFRVPDPEPPGEGTQ